MRGDIPSYEMQSPRKLKDALARLQKEPGVWRPFAGGTDLMVQLEAGQLAHRKFLSLWELDELRGIRVARDTLTLGALATYSEIASQSAVGKNIAKTWPMLAQAALETGAVAIQNRGTIGGNIANASPAADSPPALLAYDAEVELVSATGSRRVPYDEFHTGYKRTVMRPDELIRSVSLRAPARGTRHFYRKVGTRKAQAISKICFAGVLRVERGVIAHARVGLGSIAATPFRARGMEAALVGQRADRTLLIARAREALEREIRPMDDIRSTAEYRLRVASNLAEDFIKTALSRI